MSAAEVIVKRVLIAGSGPPDNEWDSKWNREGFAVIRLDIEPKTNPDFCASMTDMGEIGSYHAIFCCHALEHLYPHEVGQALKEFVRVLEPGGKAVIMVPDLEDVRPTEEVLDIPLSGPITGLHLFYGDSTQIPTYPHMAHHSGFVQKTLEHAMEMAGFRDISVRRAAGYNLMATGEK